MSSKAGNLRLLLSKGFNVPQLFELPSGITKVSLEKIAHDHFPGVEYFAVRSSADVEDGSDKSFAGHFHSEIAVKVAGLYVAYQKVLASFNEHKGKVFVQEFIPSEKAGVLFTDCSGGIMIINSCQGLCKNVVEGNACDEWYVNHRGTLLKKFISKKKPLIFINESLIHSEETNEESLNKPEISELVEEGKKIEKFFGSPQDIEWCFYRNKLYILQSRPITRKIEVPGFTFYDSANIAESYSGIVLPLTHSFAVSIYKKVYENLLMASGVSSGKILHNKHIFSNLVSNFHGRMYYNMNNWYKMMSFLPGYKRNKSNLENMLTMNIREDPNDRTLPSIWLKTAYPFIVIYKLIFFSSTIKKFSRKVKSVLNFYRAEPIEKYSAKQCLDLYEKLSNELLEKFHIPVENDFLLMTYLGILRKRYSDEELKNMIAFESISSQQIQSLSELSKKLYEVPQFSDCIDNCKEKEFDTLLINHSEVKQQILNYFEVYGSRFANELKLESADIEQDKKTFLKLLKLYREYQPLKKETKIVTKSFILNRFFRYAKQREFLRLLRSNCFSLVRRIFLRIGVILEKTGKIESSKDIFFLTLEELKSAALNQSADLISVVSKRKSDYEYYSKVTPPVFFYSEKGEMPDIPVNITNETKELKGRSCNPGVIRGKIRVFNEFVFPDSIDFDIIVARNTDPGWNALIGLSKGIILENGGILSHAAIVSRELGIPTIIGVTAATKILKTGQVVEINGLTGLIKILEE